MEHTSKRSQKVYLQKDLSKYHNSLVVGCIGEIIGVFGEHSKRSPEKFVGVKFQQISLDVMWSHLKVVRDNPQGYPHLLYQSNTPPVAGSAFSVGPLVFSVISTINQVSDDSWIVEAKVYGS